MANTKQNGAGQDIPPLPDMEASWQKMKEMLDERDRKKPFIPYLRTCAGWGLALLFTGGLLWFILGRDTDSDGINNNTSFNQKTTSTGSNSGNNNTSLNNPGTKNSITQGIENKVSEKNSENSVEQKSTTASHSEIENKNNKTETRSEDNTGITGAKLPVQKNLNKQNSRNRKSNDNNSFVKVGQDKNDVVNTGSKISNIKENTVKQDQAISVETISAEPGEDVKEESIVSNKIITENISAQDSVMKIEKSLEPVDSSLAAIKSDSTKDNTTVINKPQQDKKKKGFIYSAGIGLQQPIPLGSQKGIPYDYYGRKNSLSDYIPSVYVRMERPQKWFIQGEFRYGAPQSVKDFSYSRKTTLIDSGTVLSSTSMYLKKTYYHQLPISFNYYVRPGISVGAGIIYSRFYGAVTEKEVKKENVFTQEQSLSREVVNIKNFNNSFFYKNQLHLLLQSEFHWKQFTFGLRYTKDLQPYITFTKPDGTVVSKKNQTLVAMVRYRLWRSKKR